MTLEKIKNSVAEKKGVLHTFRYKGTRNQNEDFKGIINGLYDKVFTIMGCDSRLRAFSYSDLLVGNLEIID